MNIATRLKTLTLLGLTSLSLGAATSQADSAYFYFGGQPASNPWASAAPAPNPWMMHNPAQQLARVQAELKQRMEKLDNAQDVQMQRILQGLEQGKLTSAEAVNLLREHVSIANLERKFMADGKLGFTELNQLEQRLAEAEKHIRFESKDRETSRMEGKPGDAGRAFERERFDDRGRPDDAGRPGGFGRR